MWQRARRLLWVTRYGQARRGCVVESLKYDKRDSNAPVAHDQGPLSRGCRSPEHNRKLPADCCAVHLGLQPLGAAASNTSRLRFVSTAALCFVHSGSWCCSCAQSHRAGRAGWHGVPLLEWPHISAPHLGPTSWPRPCRKGLTCPVNPLASRAGETATSLL